MTMDAELVHTPASAGVDDLRGAIASFAAATGRLEREYGALRERIADLTAELEEKNGLLAESLERERRLEAEALRQSRLAAMGEMAAMLAHEVRNPLGAMELFTGLLLQDLRERPEALALARQVASGIAALNHLVTNLLEFTRTQRAQAAVVDCRALAEEALLYAADLCAAHRVDVARGELGPAAIALADADLLRPVLLNLIRNAVQAMPDGGTLTVRAGVDGGLVRLTIADTGPGIAPADHETVFRPFYTPRTQGTGLGLAVSRALVGAMNGRLSLESDVGLGAAFTVELPAAAGEGA
jgi:signal transduction histidine kinase